MKEIIQREDIKEIIKKGVKEVATIVKTTAGPKGRPIIIERTGLSLRNEPLPPLITKDGVSVARECKSSDPKVDLVVQSVKAMCEKTNEIAGDGTTCSMILGEAILEETFKELEQNPNLNPQLIKEDLEKIAKQVIKELEKMSMEIDTMDRVRQVATISANGEEEIGQVIGDAFEEVGAEGVVTIDEGVLPDISLDIVSGYQIRRGAEAQDRFFNNTEGTKFEAENANLIIYDGKLMNFNDLMLILGKLILDPETKERRVDAKPVVIMANEFSREVIQFLLIQKANQVLQCCAVKGPDTTHVRTAYYDDIAVMTGGYRFGSGNKALTAFEEGEEGLVRRVIIDKYTCTLYDGAGEDEAILTRVDQLNAQLKLAESPYDAQILKDRKAALTSGVAKIEVGGRTEAEIKEKYDRVEDALNAARAAIEEGVLPGGGVALLRIAHKLGKKEGCVASQILSRALKAPFYQILNNGGISSDFKDIDKILKNKKLVYDSRNNKLVNYLKAGIVDPTKVVKAALQNALSIATLLSTCGGGIIFKKDKK